MRFGPFEISFRRKDYSAVTSAPWFGLIREPFAGAWQKGLETDSPRTLLSFSAIYACVSIISSDIGKLRIKLQQLTEQGVWKETTSPAFSPVLRKPNGYQTRIRFTEYWTISKLLSGNAYAFKERDDRRVVRALHLLDPSRVTPLVAEDGGVYYQLNADRLAGIAQQIVVPASEVIHDRMNCLWHPLVGVSPLYACATTGTVGNRIQTNSSKFFENMSRPSGMLTAPGSISNETADRLKRYWEENFSGENIGRLAVAGDGLKYESMTIPAQEAQLVEQLKWSVEDVARVFKVPLYKLGGQAPTYNNVEALNQAYYTDCLQSLIESMEACLDEGLSLPDRYGVEFDLSGLLRMDTAARYEAHGKAIGAGWMAPNEARAAENLPPVEGGNSPMLQQQNWSLEQLARRDIVADKPDVAPPPAAVPDDSADEVRELLDHIRKGLGCAT